MSLVPIFVKRNIDLVPLFLCVSIGSPFWKNSINHALFVKLSQTTFGDAKLDFCNGYVVTPYADIT